MTWREPVVGFGRNPVSLNPLIQAMGAHPQPLTDPFDRETPFRHLPDRLDPKILGKPLTLARYTLDVA